MKIVITAPSYTPEKDGVQQVTKNYAERLAKLGHKVVVVCPLKGPFPEREEICGVAVKRVPVKTKYALYFGNRKRYRKLILDELRDSDALINMCAQTATTDYLYPVIRKLSCTKILWMHGMYDFRWHRTDFSSAKIFLYKIWRDIVWGIRYLLDGKYFKKYDHVIQLHRFDTATLFFEKRYGIHSVVFENSPDEFFFKNNGADNQRVRTTKDSYAICVANYIERKNQEFIIKAAYHSRNKIPLVLVGSTRTKYYHKLVRINCSLSKKYGINLVTFYDGLDRSVTQDLIIRSCMVLMGSLWEAYPISLVECMACGIPFISTDSGCAKYLPGGIVVADIKAMAYWIDLLINIPAIKTMMGNQGLIYAEKELRIDNNVQRLLKLIED